MALLFLNLVSKDNALSLLHSLLMKKSLFIEFISGIWPKLALYVKEKVDPKERTYLHKTMLREVYSADQKWEGTSAKTTYVVADMVAMDSPLPIKKRGSLATSNGKLPKVGLRRFSVKRKSTPSTL